MMKDEQQPARSTWAEIHVQRPHQRATREVERALEGCGGRLDRAPLLIAAQEREVDGRDHRSLIGWSRRLLPWARLAVERVAERVVMPAEVRQRALHDHGIETAGRLEQKRLVPVVRLRQPQLEEPVLDGRQRYLADDRPRLDDDRS